MMTTLELIKQELDPRLVARRVNTIHDDARVGFHLRSNRVEDFEEFVAVLTAYYDHHYRHCFGSRLPEAEASERAKEIVEQEFRRKNGNLLSAFEQAHSGVNGGMRVILDLIADHLREEGVRRHVNHVIDRYVVPTKWNEKVELIRELLELIGDGSVDCSEPERYASDYKLLVQAYLSNLRRTEAHFFRL